MRVAGHIKQLLALLAASMGGFALGVATTVGMVFPRMPMQEIPAWVPRAEFLGWVSIIGVGMAAVAWVYVDYRYVVKA